MNPTTVAFKIARSSGLQGARVLGQSTTPVYFRPTLHPASSSLPVPLRSLPRTEAQSSRTFATQLPKATPSQISSSSQSDGQSSSSSGGGHGKDQGSRFRRLRRSLLGVGLLSSAGFTLHNIQSVGTDAETTAGAVFSEQKTTSSATKTAESGAMEGGGLSDLPLSTIFRTYLVYTLCSIPLIVDHSPALLSALTHSSIPGVSTLTFYIVRNTFFAQFVGGETAADCVETMTRLRRDGIGTLLAYSVEVSEDEAAHATGESRSINDIKIAEAQAHVDETIRVIEEAGSFERSFANQFKSAIGLSTGTGTWVAVKITGLTPDHEVLHRASNTIVRLRQSSSSPDQLTIAYPGTPSSLDLQILNRPECYQGSDVLESLPMTAAGHGGVLPNEPGLKAGDLEKLRQLSQVLRKIADAAQKNDVRIVIDAEHSWYQPVLDAYTLMLSRDYNKEKPLIFGTYQAYLRRNPEHLAMQIADAKANGYFLGVKLVRGAYHEQERKRWGDDGRPGDDPVWPNKPATDASYNAGIEAIINQLPNIGVLFGTHNRQSCSFIIDALRKRGYLKDGQWADPCYAGKVTIGQLYGMSDELTHRVANQMPVLGTLKYVPYGHLADVMPYLGRRAVENKSLLSGEDGAAAERRRCWNEITRRAFSFISI